MYNSIGTLQYGPGGRAVVWADQDIADYYRKLIPKYYYVQPQLYPAHITVVRFRIEFPTNMDVWGKYEGEKIPFSYSGNLKTDGIYWYLDVSSERIGEIRMELGLPKFRFSDLGSERGCYHISVGNVKNQKGENEKEKTKSA